MRPGRCLELHMLLISLIGAEIPAEVCEIELCQFPSHLTAHKLLGISKILQNVGSEGEGRGTCDNVHVESPLVKKQQWGLFSSVVTQHDFIFILELWLKEYV